MTIVSTDQARAHGSTALLEVAVLHPRDAVAADEGGADRLFLVRRAEHGRLSPDPATVSAVCRETGLPVRVLLKLNETHTTNGGELARLVGLGEAFMSAGAAGVGFGFLDANTEVDTEVCGYLAERLTAVPWTFTGCLDDALDADLAWRQVRRLPGLDTVVSAGSPRGVDAGQEELTSRAGHDPEMARLVMAGNGLRAEHVPWLLRAGVRQFHVGSSVRVDGSWDKGSVEVGLVRSWRLLLDDEADRAARARAT